MIYQAKFDGIKFCMIESLTLQFVIKLRIFFMHTMDLCGNLLRINRKYRGYFLKFSLKICILNIRKVIKMIKRFRSKQMIHSHFRYESKIVNHHRTFGDVYSVHGWFTIYKFYR